MAITGEIAETAAPDAVYEAERAPTEGGFRLIISLETILYLVLLMAALVLRLPEIDTVPTSAREAHEALAVFRVLNPDSGPVTESASPLLFTANLLTMAVTGAETATLRLPTLIVSLIIVLLPLAFRRWMGAAYALVASGLLAISPVLLTSGRSTEGAVWSLALALGLIWCVGRFAESGRVSFAVVSTVLALFLAVGTEPAGFLTLLGVLIGLLFALSTDPERRFVETARTVREGWPLLRAVPIAAFAVVVVCTVFFLHPGGIGNVGRAVQEGLSGFFTRPEGHPALFPLYLSLIYEPIFWILGLAGAYFVLTGDPESMGTTRQFIGRGLLGWLVASAFFALLYQGAQPGHALWLTAPLVGLAAFAVERAIAPVRDAFWRVPIWGPWLHGVIFVAILFIGGINLLWVGRQVLNLSPSLTPAFEQQDLMRVLMIALATLLAIITFFLMGSIWGSRGAWHGIGIGLLLFAAIYQVNVGWQASVTRADDPREPWRVRPTTRNLAPIEQSIRTASLRESGKYTTSEIVVTRDVPDVVAWMLRDFTRVRYVDALTSAINAPIVIGPETSETPELGADYVGADFATTSDWDRGSLQYWDFIPWLYDRQARTSVTLRDTMILWVRADVYGVSGASDLAPLPRQ